MLMCCSLAPSYFSRKHFLVNLRYVEPDCLRGGMEDGLSRMLLEPFRTLHHGEGGQ